MTYNLYLSALLMAATCCSLILCYLSWKRRELPISISYGLGMLAGAFYTFGYAFEITSSTLEDIRFWLRVEYIGIPFGSTIWIIMVLQYTGRQALIRKPFIALLMLVPMVTFVAHYTNEWHHLFYSSMSIDSSAGFPLVHLVKGPLYALHLGYSYFFFAIGMGLMIQMYRKAMPRMKKQVAFMMIGSLGPFGFPIIYLSGILHVPIDISPFGFIFSGVFYMWGIYQFNMLRLAPLALQKVFESMQDAVIVVDLDNCITGYNQSASRLIDGLNDKGAIGQSAAELFSLYPTLLEIITKDPALNNKVQISRHGEDRFYHAHMTTISDKKLKPVGRMLLLSDITETVHYEERLLHSARQLAELNAFKDKMFNVVAHDIRDPLAVLINLMELMEEEMQTCGGSHAEIVDEMGQQIQNTFTLVESLLEWFQSQRGGMVFHPVIRDLAHTVQTNIRLMQVRSVGKNITILSEISDGLYVFADKEMLDLIIRNLLSNAIKFTEYGGSITLKAEHADGKIIVSVSDTGSGIPADQADSLLQESYPASSLGTAGERGVGLGLTLCREFVRLNGGEIWFDSTLEQGSTFYFSLPAPPKASAPSRHELGRKEIV
ncbi:Adaptive-response sensory-kinase SasA [Paenibacillus plantiphilus]|uniref:histidine kinase n=1 Tax=Paenibacillus plantiphilus TaxID=2905650 RepID=A0ABM9CJI6_9BACL|nr:histidine kinase N-terminal 7TM domain-containing protein [Paenibacillus plantiphilus]CAH1214558.1 Adaptive-response sensory-kinase SasA [Paenibacillus plantiphilus]